MAVTDDTRLGCGRTIEDVWATADEPPTLHEQRCVHCQRARTSLTDLTAATTVLRRHDEEHLRPSPRVKTAVMSLVRAQVRRSQPIPLVVPDPGSAAELTISEQAVLAVVWNAADATRGVRVRRCDVHLAPAGQRTGQPAALAINLTVAVSVDVALTTSIPAAVPDLQARIVALLAAQTGLDAQTIRVTVEDVYDA